MPESGYCWFKAVQTKITARMCDAQQKLLEHVDADAEAADEPAQLNNDETRDAEQTERTKRAWLKEG